MIITTNKSPLPITVKIAVVSLLISAGIAITEIITIAHWRFGYLLLYLD
jgi:hypothetical protein